MAALVAILFLLLVGGAISYPHIKGRLNERQRLFEIEQREEVVKGYLNDLRPQIRRRAEEYFDRKALIEIGQAEAKQAADILETDEIKELVGGEVQLQEIIEVLRSNQKHREMDVKLLNEVNERGE